MESNSRLDMVTPISACLADDSGDKKLACIDATPPARPIMELNATIPDNFPQGTNIVRSSTAFDAVFTYEFTNPTKSADINFTHPDGSIETVTVRGFGQVSKDNLIHVTMGPH